MNKKIDLPAPPPDYFLPDGSPPAWFSAMLRESGILTPNGALVDTDVPFNADVIRKALAKNLKKET